MVISRLLPWLSLITKLYRRILVDSQIYLSLFLYHWFPWTRCWKTNVIMVNCIQSDPFPLTFHSSGTEFISYSFLYSHCQAKWMALSRSSANVCSVESYVILKLFFHYSPGQWIKPTLLGCSSERFAQSLFLLAFGSTPTRTTKNQTQHYRVAQLLGSVFSIPKSFFFWELHFLISKQ